MAKAQKDRTDRADGEGRKDKKGKKDKKSKKDRKDRKGRKDRRNGHPERRRAKDGKRKRDSAALAQYPTGEMDWREAMANATAFPSPAPPHEESGTVALDTEIEQMPASAGLFLLARSGLDERETSMKIAERMGFVGPGEELGPVDAKLWHVLRIGLQDARQLLAEKGRANDTSFSTAMMLTSYREATVDGLTVAGVPLRRAALCRHAVEGGLELWRQGSDVLTTRRVREMAAAALDVDGGEARIKSKASNLLASLGSFMVSSFHGAALQVAQAANAAQGTQAAQAAQAAHMTAADAAGESRQRGTAPTEASLSTAQASVLGVRECTSYREKGVFAKGRWTPQEDERLQTALREACREAGTTLDEWLSSDARRSKADEVSDRSRGRGNVLLKVASAFRYRSAAQCHGRIKRLFASSKVKLQGGEAPSRPWVAEDYAQLKRLIGELGHRWTEIGGRMGRSPEDVRLRARGLNKALGDPSAAAARLADDGGDAAAKRIRWTFEEKAALFKMVSAQYGVRGDGPKHQWPPCLPAEAPSEGGAQWSEPALKILASLLGSGRSWLGIRMQYYKWRTCDDSMAPSGELDQHLRIIQAVYETVPPPRTFPGFSLGRVRDRLGWTNTDHIRYCLKRWLGELGLAGQADNLVGNRERLENLVRASLGTAPKRHKKRAGSASGAAPAGKRRRRGPRANAYTFFVKKMHADEAMEGLSFVERTKKISDLWKAMDEGTKARYKEEARRSAVQLAGDGGSQVPPAEV